MGELLLQGFDLIGQRRCRQRLQLAFEALGVRADLAALGIGRRQVSGQRRDLLAQGRQFTALGGLGLFRRIALNVTEPCLQ